MRHLLAVVGATATGKSELAIRLAERFDGEIVNADSRLVYRGMDIGTAKPPAAERARVPHHLIDIIDPDQPFSLAAWLDLARKAIAAIHARGRLPVLAGGSGQFVRALLEAWRVPRVPPDPELRAELETRAATPEGRRALAEELLAVDPRAGESVDLVNPRRVIRALEVHRLTGRVPSQERRRDGSPYNALLLGLWCERRELYRRIDARVDAMVAAGLLDEVRSLLAAGYSCDLASMTSIGYREVCAHLRGEMTLEQAAERIKVDTHRLARTQHNWFRRGDPRIHWLDVTTVDVYPEAEAVVEKWLGEDH